MEQECKVSEGCKCDRDQCLCPHVEALPRKEVISIQPGDKLVLTAQGTLSDEDSHLLYIEMREMFPGNEYLLLEEGMALEVYREQEKEAGVSQHNAMCDRIDAIEAQLEANETLAMEQNERRD